MFSLLTATKRIWHCLRSWKSGLGLLLVDQFRKTGHLDLRSTHYCSIDTNSAWTRMARQNRRNSGMAALCAGELAGIRMCKRLHSHLASLRGLNIPCLNSYRLWYGLQLPMWYHIEHWTRKFCTFHLVHIKGVNFRPIFPQVGLNRDCRWSISIQHCKKV